MKLYAVWPLEDDIEYDVFNGFVIRAKSRKEAIAIAKSGRDHPNWTTREIKVEGEPEIVFFSFRHG